MIFNLWSGLVRPNMIAPDMALASSLFGHAIKLIPSHTGLYPVEVVDLDALKGMPSFLCYGQSGNFCVSPPVIAVFISQRFFPRRITHIYDASND